VQLDASRTFATAEEVAAAAAQEITAELWKGARTLVLAGGSTPRRCYELLSGKAVEWGRITILFGDERCVRPDDPESNYRLARETLLDRAYPASVHRIPGELGPEAGAELYEPVVLRLLPLDLVLLGIGEDGHTASLFPDHPALRAEGWAVPVRQAPKPPPDRVSLSLAALRAARRVMVLATGADKASAVAKARRGEVPAGLIPHAEWLLDSAAAGG
jgi:6-phosphogluconolactonase